jgi:glutamine amidotransferase
VTTVKIAIIDYGLGNLRSVRKGFERSGGDVIVTSNMDIVSHADGVVLPGVGAFSEGMENAEPLRKNIIEISESGIPMFGICLGMQMLLTESEESEGVGQGDVQGLDLIPGKNVRIRNEKVPHMGWNELKIVQEHPFVKGVDGLHAYFVHSYHAVPDDNSAVISTTEYGVEFASIIARENVFGTQFHPEKSGETGLKILRNFIEFCQSV